MAKAKGDITINEKTCQGCGYCSKFCNRGCITWPGGKFTPEGFALPAFTDASKCTACEMCAWMCPAFSIDVYKYDGVGTAA